MLRRSLQETKHPFFWNTDVFRSAVVDAVCQQQRIVRPRDTGDKLDSVALFSAVCYAPFLSNLDGFRLGVECVKEVRVCAAEFGESRLSTMYVSDAEHRVRKGH